MAVYKKDIPKFFITLGVIVTVATGASSSRPISQNASIADYLKHSIIGTAKAESEFISVPFNGDACWNASFTNSLLPCPTPPIEEINICLVENSTTSLPVYYYTSNELVDTYHQSILNSTLITQTPLTGLTLNPIFLSTTTPYLTDFNRINYQLDLTAPAVPFGTSPLLTTVDVDGDFTIPTGSRNLSHDVLANVRMEHTNTGPTLSNLSPTNHNQVLASSGSTISLPVSVDYNDNENNQANLVFELSSDNFGTILQTQNVNAVTSGSTANTMFTNLGVGQYQWRVSATETDALGNCIGYANEDPPINLSTQIGPTSVSLTAGSEQLASTGENKNVPIFAAIMSLIVGIGIVFRRSIGLKRDK